MKVRTILTAAGLVGIALAVAGCSTRQDTTPAADTYTVRGVVEKMPQPDGPDKAIYIHHVPIPGYRDETGQTVGMMSMTMPFPVGKGVSLAGLAPGDAVEFTFKVTWKPRSGYELTRIQKLPPGSVVEFNAAAR